MQMNVSDMTFPDSKLQENLFLPNIKHLGRENLTQTKPSTEPSWLSLWGF